MKTKFRSAGGRRPFPVTDYCFQSDLSDWRGSSWHDGGDNSEFRKFNNLNREFLLEFARERKKEMIVFALIVIASAWPVIYMVVSVVRLLLKGRPLD